MNESILATLGIGFLLGLKHATEADHLAAVSTIVSQRRSLSQSAMVGALWGAGHTASLLVVGFLVIAMGLAIPDRIANLFELAVAVMIVFLGMRILRLHVHSHRHGGTSHAHLHFQDDAHTDDAHMPLSSWRAALVGMMHGLAGSAALTLLVLSQVLHQGGTVLAFAYLVVFGFGSIGGMLVMSSLIGLPFSLGFRLSRQTLVPLRVLTGIFSTTFGVFYALRILSRLSVF
jgi:hypothetical protein